MIVPSIERKMDLIEPMFDAVVSGEEQLILTYLNMGGDISAQGDDGQNCLHWAAASPFGEQLLSFLIARGANLSAEDNMGYTPLHLHALRGRTYGTSCLLQAGAQVNAVSTKNGFTPLHLAILHNHIEVANILLAYGADYQLLENLRDLSALTQSKLQQPVPPTGPISNSISISKKSKDSKINGDDTSDPPSSPSNKKKVKNKNESDNNIKTKDTSELPSGEHGTPISIAATTGGEEPNNIVVSTVNTPLNLTPLPQQQQPSGDSVLSPSTNLTTMNINLMTEFSSPPHENINDSIHTSDTK